MEFVRARCRVVEIYKARIRNLGTKAMEIADKYMVTKSPIMKCIGKVKIAEFLNFTKLRCNVVRFTDMMVARGEVNSVFNGK